MASANHGKVRWEEMFPDEFQAALERCPACLAAYGLAEPHGPYNALGLDFLKARALVERSARVNGGIVAPPFAWHVQERPEFDYFGARGVTQTYCSSIPADLFLKIVLYQLRAIDARGFHAAILVTGHYGGLENDMRLLCEFYLNRAASPLRLRACADCELIRYQDYRGDHAGVCETSQLMALRPALVDLGRDVESSAFGQFAGTSFPTGAGEMPSEELGRHIVDSQIKRLGEIQKELLAGYGKQDDRRVPSLNDVESIWVRFERLTRKYWWCSLTLDEYEAGKHVEFPGWESLGE